MRKSKFSPHQIAKILKEFDNNKSVSDTSLDHGTHGAAFYKRRSKYVGINFNKLKRINKLEEEN